MKFLLQLSVIAVATSGIQSAEAFMLPFVEEGFLSRGPMDIVSPPFGGTLLASMTSTDTGTVSYEGYWTNVHDAPGVRHPNGIFYDAPITGTLTSAVYKVGANLDFYYQFVNDQKSYGNFSALFGSDYVGLGKSTVDVYQTRDAVGPFVAGAMSFANIDRLNFYARNTTTVASNSLVSVFGESTMLAPGNASYTEIVRTAGIEAYTEGSFTANAWDIAGHRSTNPYAALSAYVPWFEPIVPAVPEPETYALMLAGLGVIAAAVRRLKAGREQALNCSAPEGATA